MKAPSLIWRSLGRLGSDRRGQVTVFFALAAMLFVCMMAFVVNLGLVVHERILVQAVADTVALSAANVQAVGMNEIADLHAESYKLFQDMMANIPGRTFLRNHGDSQFDYYQEQFDKVEELSREAAEVFSTLARRAAVQTFNKLNDTYSGNGKYEQPWAMDIMTPQSGYPEPYLIPVEGVRTGTVHWRELWPQRNCCYKRRYRRRYWCCNKYSFFQYEGDRTPDHESGRWCEVDYRSDRGRYRWLDTAKPGEITVYYAVRIRHRKRPEPLIDLAEMGFAPVMPKVEAYAVAQPIGGDISARDPSYQARLVSVRTKYFKGFTNDGKWVDMDSWPGDLAPKGLFRH